MTDVTIDRRPAHPLLSGARPLLVTVALALLGGLAAWAFGWSPDAYFAIAILATAAGGWLATRRLLAESRAARAEAGTAVPAAARSTAQGTTLAAGAPQVLVGLIGYSRSGKTEIADWVAGHHPDWAWASCGRFVLAEAKQQGFAEGEREVTDKLGNDLVSRLGAKAFAEQVLAGAKIPAGSSLLMVDDIYHEGVWEALAEDRRVIAVQIKSLDPGPAEESFLDREAAKLLKDVHPVLQITGAGRDSEESGRELIEKVEERLAAA
jgi:hypothetical protein